MINLKPTVTDETRIISKSVIKYLSHVPRKHGFKEVHKIVILVNAHILRKNSKVKVQHFQHAQ
jgi:hypothetical protein